MLNLLTLLLFLINFPNTDSVYVQKVVFFGNETFNSKLLKKIILTHEKELLNEIYLTNDIHLLTQFYQNQGFNSVVVESELRPLAQGKLVCFKITEGDRVKISQINFAGNDNFSASKLRSLIKLRQNDFLIKSNLEDAQKTISNFYKNSGFPFIEIEPKITIKNDKAIIDFLITEGPLSYIKAIRIRGNQQVAEWVIRQTLELKNGERFSLQKIEQARQRLYSTKLFEKISFYIIDTVKQESLTIRFDVLEQLPRSFGIGFGIQTPPARLIFSGEWEHVNFLSRGHYLLLSLGYAPTFATDWRGEIKGTYRISYIFTTPLNLLLQPTFKYELKDSVKERSISADIGISRTFGQKFEIGTFLRYFRVWLSSLYSLPPSTYPSLSRYNITNSENIYLSYDSRDNIFTPANGLLFSYSFQFAGSILGGDNDFYKSQAELATFKQLPLSLIFCSRIMAGLIIPYGRTTQIPYFEAFYIGGNNGLRGYNEKAIGPYVIGQEHYGDAINNINFEIRTHFEKLIDLVIFSDIATVIDRHLITDIDITNYHYSAGLGLRINTPFGPIRIDYAKRLKEPPANDWGKIHLALLNVF